MMRSRPGEDGTASPTHTHTHIQQREKHPTLISPGKPHRLGEVGMLSKGTNDNLGEKHAWINTTDEGETEGSSDGERSVHIVVSRFMRQTLTDRRERPLPFLWRAPHQL